MSMKDAFSNRILFFCRLLPFFVEESDTEYDLVTCSTCLESFMEIFSFSMNAQGLEYLTGF